MRHLFQPFVQADGGLARTKGGLGLGLALVKGLAELHGGSVTASSAGPNLGSEFVVRFPLAAAPQFRALAPVARTGAAALDMLVVEDNLDAAQSLAEVLRLDGHRVRIASDGTSGIASAREHRPDVVLCDIGLPDVNGVALVFEIVNSQTHHEYDGHPRAPRVPRDRRPPVSDGPGARHIPGIRGTSRRFDSLK